MAHVEIGRTDDVQDSARALAALEHVRDGVALMRPVRDDAGAVVDFVYAYLNRRGGGAAGASTLLGRRLLDVLPEFPRALFEGLVAVLAGGEPLHTNVDAAEVYVGHDGIAGHFRLEASRIGDALLVVYADIGARASTSSLQERYGAVLEATSDWVSIADRDQNLVYVNAGGRQMVGIGLDEEIRGRRVGEFSPRWAREYVRRVALKVAREEGVWRGNLARLHRDGHEIPVSQVIVARTGEDGEVDFYATIARDMTGERAAQDALRASEERFRVAFEQAPIGFALLDLDGRYLQINDAYCARCGARARS